MCLDAFDVVTDLQTGTTSIVLRGAGADGTDLEIEAVSGADEFAPKE